jgi:hypothetical protein
MNRYLYFAFFHFAFFIFGPTERSPLLACQFLLKQAGYAELVGAICAPTSGFLGLIDQSQSHRSLVTDFEPAGVSVLTVLESQPPRPVVSISRFSTIGGPRLSTDTPSLAVR